MREIKEEYFERVSYGAPIAVSSECKTNSSADCTCDAESAIATSTAIQLSLKKFMTTFFSNKIEGCHSDDTMSRRLTQMTVGRRRALRVIIILRRFGVF